MKTDVDVLIIGTGFSGLGMAIRLRQTGQDDFVILEQAAAIGGTWRDNHYPGVACDVPSHLYSFSFEPNPRWSRLFAPQAEILAYLEHCADKYDVRSRIRFGSEVVRAVYDQHQQRWEVSTKGGARYRARVVVSGCGGLSRPSLPAIAGAERFAGKTFHTARWDHTYALEGKRVAVIGTGASAIQVVPALAPRVAQLLVFQRTPPWIMPKPDLRIGRRQQQRMADHPWLQRGLRRLIYWLMESRVLGFKNVLPSMQVRAERRAREYLAAQVADPTLRAKLTPNYRVGCKRVLISNDYFAALQKPNSALITAGIAEIREHSIATVDGGEHPVDAIVYATGFQAAEQAAPFPVRGRGGRELEDAWRDGAEAYLGITVHGFPNFFVLTGPNTGLGHNSMVFMIESQIQYVLASLAQMRERGLASVEVKRTIQDDFNKQLHARLSDTVWMTGGCSSWYNTRSGKNTTLWPGFTFEYRFRTQRFDAKNYELGRLDASEAAPAELPRNEPSVLRSP
jgi:cation diffusion facilitator CzcD-associated flavoprotein CzcO